MRRFWISDFGFGICHRVRFKAKGARSIFTSPRRNCRAFTLIELIGVMAIIGILSAVVLPPLISKIEDANSVGEDAKLEEIARALVAGIKAQGRIPNPTSNPTAADGWAAMATNYSVLGTNELIRSILTSTNDTVRRYFLSPALTNFLATNYATPARGWSTNNFTNGPLYFMLVSVSKDGLLFGNGCTTNNNMASNNVLFLQNWAKTNNSSGRVEVNNLDIVGNIAGTSTRWTNRGEFLHVKVVDLKQLFCRVELEDFRSPPSISITNSGTNYTGLPITQTTTNGFSLTITANSSSNLTSVSFGSAPGKLIWSNTSGGPYSLDITNGGGTNGKIYISFPSIPSFSVGASTLSALTSQEESFYVLKGSLLNLTNSSSIIIQQDSKYQYLNDTWRQLY